MKAMCANLEKRYPSADAMLEDLEKFRKNNSVDLGYIRADLEEPEDHEPTQAIPTAAIQAARKERTPAEEKKRDKKLIAIVGGRLCRSSAGGVPAVQVRVWRHQR